MWPEDTVDCKFCDPRLRRTTICNWNLDARLHRLATVWTPQHHHRLKSIKLLSRSEWFTLTSLLTYMAYIRVQVHCAWRRFKMLLLLVWLETGRLKRGSCNCSLCIPQRSRANNERPATFEEQQTLEIVSNHHLTDENPENPGKSGRLHRVATLPLWQLRAG